MIIFPKKKVGSQGIGLYGGKPQTFIDIGKVLRGWISCEE